MSNDSGMSIWISDLDGYINPGYINLMNELGEREQENDQLRSDLIEMGDISLLAGKKISAQYLFQKNLSASEWYHSLHLAEMSIGQETNQSYQESAGSSTTPETLYVKKILELGRQYAIARYSHWENIDYQSALTATLPYGIRALINQFLISEKIIRTQSVEQKIRDILNPRKIDGMIAYDRVGLLQQFIHQIADTTPSHLGSLQLGREKMRVLLSLTRLHFSTAELKLKSINELQSLLTTYDTKRQIAELNSDHINRSGRYIKKWQLRHIQPLINLYPYTIRHSIKRAISHKESEFDRNTLINELALTHCEIIRMRRTRQEKKSGIMK